jgi:hypothetical protein
VDLRERLRDQIRSSGIRVEQRLQLVDLVFSEHGVEALQDRLEQAQVRLDQALAALRKAAIGR